MEDIENTSMDFFIKQNKNNKKKQKGKKKKTKETKGKNTLKQK